MGLRAASVGHRSRAVGLGLLCLASLVWVDATTISGGENTKDGAQYERIAVELAQTGSFSSNGALTREVEPLHVGLMAAQIRLDPRLREVRVEGRVAEGNQSRALKQQNLLWSGILLAGVATQVLILRRGGRPTYFRAGSAVVACTVLLLENPDVVDRSLAELPAASLVVWSGVLATRLVRSPTAIRALALGATVGLLVLTRAVFLYVAVPYAILLGMMLLSAGPRDGSKAVAARRTTVLGVAALVGFGAVVGPWAARNALTFGDAAIAERGSQVLLIRATKNEMNPYQHRGAWVYWAPLPLQAPIARAIGVDPEDFEFGRPLSALARYSEDEAVVEQTFYKSADRTFNDRVAVLEAEGRGPADAIAVAEAEFTSWALERLRTDPGATLRTTPVFLWRFSWPMNFSMTVPRPLLGFVNLAGMAALLFASAFAVVRRRPTLFAVVGLPAGATAFYSLVTHALPRYARPLAPTMIVLLVVGVSAAWDWGRRRLRQVGP